jgi:hypothetical protein
MSRGMPSRVEVVTPENQKGFLGRYRCQEAEPANRNCRAVQSPYNLPPGHLFRKNALKALEVPGVAVAFADGFR